MSAQRQSPPRARSRVADAAGWSGAALFAWVAGSFPSFTWQATAAVLAPGIALFLVGTLAAPGRVPAPHSLPGKSALVWSVPVLAFCALEIVNDLLGSTAAHPTLSVLLDPVFDDHLLRSAGFLGWLVAGWRLTRM